MSLPSRQSWFHNGTVAVRVPRPKVAAAPRPRARERLPFLIAAPIILTVSLALWAAIVVGVGKLVGWL